MSRDLTTDMANAVQASTVRPILLFEGEYVTTTVRYWTGIGTLSWDGQSWLGVGNLIEATPIQETDDVKASGISIKLNGASIAAITEAFTEMRSGKAGSIRLGLLTEAGAVIDRPKIIFRGRLDLVEVDDSDPGKPVLMLAYEHELIDLKRPREWRFTGAHQQKLHAGDTGCRFVAALQDAQLTWGQN